MENNKKYTASHIANYFLWRAWEDGIEITPMMLIKLVYIAYGWNLVMNNGERLFEEPILAWNHGPVIPSLYYEFREFGKNPIPKGCYSAVFNDYEESEGKTKKLESVPIISDDDYVLKILNAEWNHYKNFNGIELSNMTHAYGSPWQKAIAKGRNTRLDDSDIIDRSSEAIDRLMNQSKS